MEDSDIIGADVVCSQRLREYFKSRVGKGFSFLVPFQEWLRANQDKTLKEACEAWKVISCESRCARLPIWPQFKYNAFIRKWFDENPGTDLAAAAKAWNEHKKQQ